MELDELRIAWQELDHRLEQQRTSSLQALRWGKLDQARRGLQPLWWGQSAQIVAGVGLMLLFARIWVAHMHAPHLMVPALLMYAYGLMLVLLAARTLSLVGRIDYAAPVLQIQRRLSELHGWRSRVEWPLLGITGCFVWIPLMLSLFNAQGVDLWRMHRDLVFWNVASGCACLGLVYGIVRWVRGRKSGRAQLALEDSRVGRGVRKARETLDEIARFEQE
jgi:hypothetical protein